MTNPEIYDTLVRFGADTKNGHLWYPGYYSTSQIAMDAPKSTPSVRMDLRGAQPTVEEAVEFIKLHVVLDILKAL